MEINREKCVLCDYNQFEQILKIEKYPCSISCITKEQKEYFFNFELCKCVNCGLPQLKKLVPLDILYLTPHNNEIIGKTWKEHHEKFSDFIYGSLMKCDKKEIHILEIGDPSFKTINNLCDKISCKESIFVWDIVDPNCKKNDNKYKNINVNIFNCFFEDCEKDMKYDFIIHSHVFEHFYKPKEVFKNMCELLNDEGIMICSVPIMEKYDIPLYGIFFEHTYFLNKKVMEYFSLVNDMEIEKQIDFYEHSNFYSIKKKKGDNVQLPRFTKHNNLNIKEKINILNTILDNTNNSVFIASSSFVSQFMIYSGILIKKISGILDNDKYKQDKIFYGTGLNIYDPKIIKNKENCIVIFFNMPYTAEMIKQICEINKNIIILKI